MKALTFFAFLCVSAAWAQTPAPTEFKGEIFPVTFEDGGKLTADEFKGLLQIHPTWQPLPTEQAVHEYAILRKAASMAQAKHLEQQSPYKEAIDFQVMYTMADAWAQDEAGQISVTPAEVEKYYNDNKEPFRSLKVSGLMVAFGKAPAGTDGPANASKPVKKALTEDEAKAKAEKLLVRIRAGEDFAKVIAAESDDVASKEKQGSLGSWNMADNIPTDLRQAVFGLKMGEVSEPIRQAGGYWLVRVDSVTYKPLSDVQDSIFEQVRKEKIRKVLTDFDKDTKVVFSQKQNEPLPPAAAPPSNQKK